MADYQLLGTALLPAFFNEGVDAPHVAIPVVCVHLQDASVSSSPTTPTNPARTTTLPWQDVRDFQLLGRGLWPTMLGAPGYELYVPGQWTISDSAWPTTISTTYLRQSIDVFNLYDTVVSSKIVTQYEQTTYTRIVTESLLVIDWSNIFITVPQRFDFWGETDYYREVAALMRIESFTPLIYP